MRLSRSQCDNLRRACSGALAETSGAVVQSVADILRLPAQRCIATSAPVCRYSRVKDPLGTAGDTTGGVPHTARHVSHAAVMQRLFSDLCMRMQAQSPKHTW